MPSTDVIRDGATAEVLEALEVFGAGAAVRVPAAATANAAAARAVRKRRHERDERGKSGLILCPRAEADLRG
jgi:hypothetical protein